MEKSIGPINSIVLARASDSDKIYKKDQNSIAENGLCELLISENQFMNFNDRADYLQELSDKLFGVEYYLNDFVSTGIMYYDLLDSYNVKIGESIYNCLMLNDEQTITQGLEENIHTDRPETSETDYTKADKTDRKINQTYFIVDKQNRKIKGLINQIGDRTDKTTTITADIDGLNSKVSNIADLTNETSGTQVVTLENCAEGEVVELHIYGNNTVFGYQYLSNDLYLSDSLFLGKDKSIIVVTDGEGKKTNYNLKIEEVLRQNGDVCDEYILKNGQAKIIRRINRDGTIKDNETTENLGELHILLKKGNYTLEIKDFSASIYVKWAVQNEYTDIFATRVEMNSNIEQSSQKIETTVNKKFENYSTTTEMNSTITQTAESINTEVKKKVGNDEVISKINQSAETVGINANKIELSAIDVLNLLAGNTINLTSKNIAISSKYLNIDYEGNLVLNSIGGNVLKIKNPNYSSRNIYMNDQFIGINADSENGVVIIGVVDKKYGTIMLRGNGTTTVSANKITTPILEQTSLATQKKNIEKMKESAIKILKDIDIYKYNLKNEKGTKKKHIGFVIGDDFNYSQEVTGENNEGVDTYSFISLCCKAIQEQQQQIENLENKIKGMEEKINEKN